MDTLLDGHHIKPVTESDVYGKQPKPDDAGVPGLEPGQEVRFKSFVVTFGGESPRELVDLLSTKNKFRPRPPIMEVDFNRDRHIISVWYVVGGLLNAPPPPPAKKEKKEKKDKFDDAPDAISESAKLTAVESSDLDDLPPPPDAAPDEAAPSAEEPALPVPDSPVPPPPSDDPDADLDAEIAERGSEDPDGAAGAGTGGPHRPPWAG